MAIWILRILSYIFLLYLLYFSQEVGRYLLGRRLGVPGSSIKIDMVEFPQRTSIYDGERWVSSNEERFLKAYSRYDVFWEYGFLFASSGIFGESALTVIITLSCALLRLDEIALAAVLISTGLNLVQMAYSIIISWRGDEIKGDYTVIHKLNARLAAGLVFFVFLLRLALFAAV